MSLGGNLQGGAARDSSAYGAAPWWGPALALALLGLLALCGLAAALWLGERTRHHDQQVLSALGAGKELAGEIQSQALAAAGGDTRAFGRLRRSREGFDRELRELRALESPWPVVNPQVNARALEDAWRRAKDQTDRVLSKEEPLLGLRDDLQRLEPMLGALMMASEQLLDASTDDEWSPTQSHFAYMQWVLAKRLLESVQALLGEGIRPGTLSEALNADNELLLAFGKVHNGFVIGDPSIGLERLTDPGSRRALARVGELYRRTTDVLRGLLYHSLSLLEARRAAGASADGLVPALDALMETTRVVRGDYRAQAARRDAQLRGAAMVAGIAALLFFAGALRVAWRGRAAAARAREASAVMGRLQADIEGLGAGDPGRAPRPGQASAGSVAEALEAAVGTLRDRLDAIRQSATDVAALVLSTRRHTARLYSVSDEQAAHLGVVAGAARELAAAAGDVSTQIQESRGLVQRSVDDAERAARVAHEGLMGLDGVRATLHDTITPAGRLRETCDTVADLASVLEELSEQAHVAALNVAIRAARDRGEEGRSFTLAADDLQRLAARLGETTRRMAEVSRGMGSQAEDVLGTIEQSATGMEVGVGLMEGMAHSVAELEDCARKVSDRIRNVVDASRQQASRVAEITRRIELTADHSAHAVHEARVTGSVVDELAGQVTGLGRAVERLGSATNARPTRIASHRDASLPKRHAAVRARDGGRELSPASGESEQVNDANETEEADAG
ncbi:MAG: methyl-accepting chemotaxis protein [Gammaproteobacteria bacterium]|nr:methyl-accepting chemotaxis protein [Gammaproteobacteria bacterium]NIR85546.1 methyl-accepting chemotaxis protein [Gammaproteobacteria bacterium]NIR89805.1 methyl-accepting chemotaxis protein [Gammaproteobacteria bacterium]NIU06681.1 methyl-accepting chemotaxis protein [Gammaproteobacteria bacterium]NIV75072.1 hypothetical protein [Gammaproteobacteria bacterium]